VVVTDHPRLLMALMILLVVPDRRRAIRGDAADAG
jgi:hypothetical protein